ncbi:MAG: HpcH/HpaI aldolase/citrate lyase family protein [Deltaproteobacteria bacterium]|nr:HpcH/HpaI aldolase/citrate lyase family protein [Deltaproteobacteria bacterium]MBW1960736.1 HpcH/HpaI aldolase/citrate lyase family protein [Deltaproteobacteria bacterium]MBW1993640.1 HpcH/HpaI aldolase/citrate lyase family protein [Deltaproteobacteria bacterium]MBW2152608.1 HpcH/HpaI aldolase/citrate lyase family protein [Deltaproteobacteria bacterium]
MDQQKPFENHVKRMLKAGKKTAGAWAQITSPISAEILSGAGFDWLIIDMEHGPNDIPSLVAQMQAMKGTSAIPIVRAPWNDFVMIKRILDAGAYGLLIPYVNTKSEAEAAVKACKYPPSGIRGIAGSTRAAHFGRNSMDYFSKANEEILVITQVETRQAVENIDEILEVNGLDGIFIGPMDLATSYGYMYDPGQPEVQSAIESVEAKVKGTGKFLGTISFNWNQAKQLYQRGYQMISLMADGTGLAAMAEEKMADFRNTYPSG